MPTHASDKPLSANLSPLLTVTRRRVRILGALAALCVVAYAPAVLSLFLGAYPFVIDGPALMVPWREFARQTLAQGLLPLWNPHLFCGRPFLTNGQTTLLYPTTLINWFLPAKSAFLLDAILHNILLAWGAYAFARALRLSRTASCVAAVALALGGSVSAHYYAGQTVWNAAKAYLPWALWALLWYLRTGRRRYAFLLAGFLALQSGTGFPQIMMLTLSLGAGLSLAWIIFQRRNHGGRALPTGWPTTMILAAALTFVLAAVYILPLRETMRFSARSGGLSYEETVRFPGSWRSLVRLLAPTFFGNNDEIQWSHVFLPHDEAAYLGLLPVILAAGAPLLARRQTGTGDQGSGFKIPPPVLWLWLLLPLAVLLAMGDNTPFYRWLFDYFPPVRLLRIPARWFELWSIAAALLAGFAYDGCIHRARPGSAGPRLLLLVLRILSSVFVVLALALLATSPRSSLWLHTAQWNLQRIGAEQLQVADYLRATALLSALITALLAGLTAVLLAKLQGSTLPRQRRLEVMLVALITLDVLGLFWRSTRIIPPREINEFVAWPTTLTRHYQPGQRWDTRVPVPAINQNMVAGIDLFNGYDPMSGQRYFDFVHALEGPRIWSGAYQPLYRSPLLRVAGVTHTLSMFQSPALTYRQPRPRRGTPPVVLLDHSARWKLWKHRDAWPRVYLSRRTWRVPEPRQLPLLAALAEDSFAASQHPVVVAPHLFDDVAPAPLTARDRVVAWQRDINRMTTVTSTAAPSILVQAEALYPGWRAWVNGQPAPLESANYLFRAVRVPAGEARVNVVYDSQTYRYALFLSLCGLAVVVAMGVAHLKAHLSRSRGSLGKL